MPTVFPLWTSPLSPALLRSPCPVDKSLPFAKSPGGGIREGVPGGGEELWRTGFQDCVSQHGLEISLYPLVGASSTHLFPALCSNVTWAT